MRLIAISGMMGSGKTTLARHLTHLLGWRYAPESARGTAFLRDMFANPQRWAFDAQLSFLAEKAIALQKHLNLGLNVVLDRTIEEDIAIFAQHFYSLGFIDQRSFDTYKSIYQHFESILPIPDVHILCTAPLATINERLAARGRELDKLYPPNHISTLYEKYAEWIYSKTSSTAIPVDTEAIDFRQREPVVELIEAINRISAAETLAQYPLFDEIGTVERTSKRGRRGQFLPRSAVAMLAASGAAGPDSRSIRFPYVYIAAPFSAVADANARASDEESAELFPTDRGHGEIGRGWYRRNLLRIANELEGLGLFSILPHRDVNEWGKKLLQSTQVFDACSDHVRNCDLFLGVLGQSPGSHYEFGVAAALTKPSIIVHCEQLHPSYLSLGISGADTLVLRCKTLSQVPTLLRTAYVKDFLRANVPGLK